MSEGVLTQFRADLTERRSGLVVERDHISAEAQRLTAEAEEVQTVIRGIDQILGTSTQDQRRTAEQVLASRTKKVEAAAVQGQFGQLLIKHLKAAYPQGLTSAELFRLIQPEWMHGGEMSPRRIGVKCNRTIEIVGADGRWYYVPADPKVTDG